VLSVFLAARRIARAAIELSSHSVVLVREPLDLSSRLVHCAPAAIGGVRRAGNRRGG
jgi:hypothetical protein